MTRLGSTLAGNCGLSWVETFYSESVISYRFLLKNEIDLWHPLLLLMSVDGRPAMNSKWRSFVGVPYLGEGQKLKTRRVHDIAMGGHQLMADGVHWWNPNEMHGGNQPEMAEPMPEPNPVQPHPAMPECIFIGTEEMVAMAQAMFQSPGHENYSDCVAMTHEQAEMAAAGMN